MVYEFYFNKAVSKNNWQLLFTGDRVFPSLSLSSEPLLCSWARRLGQLQLLPQAPPPPLPGWCFLTLNRGVAMCPAGAKQVTYR